MISLSVALRWIPSALADTSKSCPATVLLPVELELHSWLGGMMLSDNGAFGGMVIADSHSVINLHGAGYEEFCYFGVVVEESPCCQRFLCCCYGT